MIRQKKYLFHRKSLHRSLRRACASAQFRQKRPLSSDWHHLRHENKHSRSTGINTGLSIVCLIVANILQLFRKSLFKLSDLLWPFSAFCENAGPSSLSESCKSEGQMWQNAETATNSKIWMDELRVLRTAFQSYRKGEYERHCAMKRCLGSRRISPPAGIETATPWSEAGKVQNVIYDVITNSWEKGWNSTDTLSDWQSAY